MQSMKLDGLTYEAVAKAFSISRQRVQQILEPPVQIRNAVIRRAEGKCENCGIMVGYGGHVHHLNGNDLEYSDISNLQLLCPTCHRWIHSNGDFVPSERDTVILPVRIKKTLMTEIDRNLKSTKQVSRNAWLIWAIKQGLRSHRKMPDAPQSVSEGIK